MSETDVLAPLAHGRAPVQPPRPGDGPAAAGAGGATASTQVHALVPAHAAEVGAGVRLARRALLTGRASHADDLTVLLLREWFAPEAAAPTAHVPDLVARLHTAADGALAHDGGTALDGAPVTTATLTRRVTTRSNAGVWRMWGARWAPRLEQTGANLLHVFLSCPAAALPQLVGRLTGHAASWDEPWAFRASTTPGRTDRTDSTCLYLPVASFGRLTSELLLLLDDIVPLLADDRPALTFPVAPGVGAGQNPIGGPTFGELRCLAVAQAVAAQPDASYPDLERAVRGELVRLGVDPRRPYRVRDALPWEKPWH